LTERPRQIQAHLKHLRLPLVGDELYGGPPLWLSTLKPQYRLKPGHTENPLIARAALHAEQLLLRPPGADESGSGSQGASARIQAPWPKDLAVAVKYLRRFAGMARPPARPAQAMR
jgi:23S rRNA pseudouridine955/2504/2580 synthase